MTDRDQAIIRFVARYDQASSRQLERLFFDTNQSPDVYVRTLRRLYESKYLHRIERRPVGGNGSGSGAYVYGLGINGFRVVTPRGGKFSPQRVINHHKLGIVEAHVRLIEAERKGLIELTRVLAEPDSWWTIEGIKARPDLDVAYSRFTEPHHWWLEIDLGTESLRDLGDKMNNLLDAKEAAGRYEVQASDGTTHIEVVEPEPFPAIIFIVPDEYRVEEVRYVIKRLGDEAANTFRVVLADNFPHHVL